MVKKNDKNQKTFQTNAKKQGGKDVPMKQVKEYGTGMPCKKPKQKLAVKKK